MARTPSGNTKQTTHSRQQRAAKPTTLEAITPSHTHHKLPPGQPPRGVALIPRGSVTSPQGFVAGAVFAGIKTLGAEPLDVGILSSDRPATVAAVFTRSSVKGAAVLHSMMNAKNGRARGVVVNAGISNVGTGAPGATDAAEMARLAAGRADAPLAEMLVGSTGVIGRPLPMEKIRDGIARIILTATGGHDFARAIMTTDTHPKSLAVRVGGAKGYTIGAVAKGSGMIHPDMATMFCFITTDAAVERGALTSAFRESVDASLNMLSIDGDTSTSDTVAIFANGASTVAINAVDPASVKRFRAALQYVCTEMAKMLARDGEGAAKLIEIRVEGASTLKEARAAARTVSASPLVKTAVHGNDPNWGRLLMAIGRSYIPVDLTRTRAWVGGVAVYDRGIVDFDRKAASRELRQEHVVLRVHLGAGKESATAWGCDMTPEYVHINADYTT